MLSQDIQVQLLLQYDDLAGSPDEPVMSLQLYIGIE